MRPLRYFVVTCSRSIIVRLMRRDQGHLQLHFAGQSNRHNDSRSQQIVPLIQPYPCKRRQHEGHVVDIQGHACHHDIARNISKVLDIRARTRTPFVSSVSPFAALGTAHHRWLAR
jgi:hypothetical protein